VSLASPTLSDEQRRAVARASAGHPLAIVARAGAGKTHTLRAVAAARPQVDACLLAFNRSVAREARTRLPPHARATTVHALAYRTVVAPDPRMRAKLERATRAGPADWGEAAGLAPRDPATAAHVAAIRSVLQRFLADDAEAPEARHLAPDLAATLEERLGSERFGERRRWLLRRAARLWTRIGDPDDPTPLPHDGYLKLFARADPPAPAPLLLVDEAQDIAPVTLGWLRRLSVQVVLVGDPAQRIYGFRGAVDAMAASGHPEVRLTRSFRFGEEIAACARRVLRVLAPGAALGGTGGPGRVHDDPPTRTGPDGAGSHAVLCRSTAGVVEAIVAHADLGVHVVGGVDTLVPELEAAYRLWTRRHDGRGPVLHGFDRWSDLARTAEAHGGGLRTLRDLIERYGDGVPELTRRLRGAVRARSHDAPITVSTVHRAKGGEWDRVELWRDLPRVPGDPEALAAAPDPESARAEANLLYVAVTRARRELLLHRTREDVRRLLLGRDA
jgi:superfamily I DNA/RNA helicase